MTEDLEETAGIAVFSGDADSYLKPERLSHGPQTAHSPIDMTDYINEPMSLHSGPEVFVEDAPSRVATEQVDNKQDPTCGLSEWTTMTCSAKSISKGSASEKVKGRLQYISLETI